jgi:hypothetical protein
MIKTIWFEGQYFITTFLEFEVMMGRISGENRTKVRNLKTLSNNIVRSFEIFENFTIHS